MLVFFVLFIDREFVFDVFDWVEMLFVDDFEYKFLGKILLVFWYLKFWFCFFCWFLFSWESFEVFLIVVFCDVIGDDCECEEFFLEIWNKRSKRIFFIIINK